LFIKLDVELATLSTLVKGSFKVVDLPITSISGFRESKIGCKFWRNVEAEDIDPLDLPSNFLEKTDRNMLRFGRILKSEN
jgi:hypothetical protein